MALVAIIPIQILSSANFLNTTVIAFFAVICVVIVWLYFTLPLTGKKQATPGRRLMDLVVCDMNGEKLTFGRATGRFFMSIISGILLYIGYLIFFFTDRNQTLHDKVAGTVVMYKGE